MQPRIIAITGASGSGKTRFTELLSRQLAPSLNLAEICEDRYYRDQSSLPMERRLQTNYDHPDSLEHDLLLQHLGELRRGQPVEVPTYDYHTHNRGADIQQIEPAELVLVEGTLLLSGPALRGQFDLTVFIDAPLELCLERRIDRDRRERGRSPESVVAQFERTVRPMYYRYVRPAKDHADIVLGAEESDAEALARVVDALRGRQLLAPEKLPD